MRRVPLSIRIGPRSKLENFRPTLTAPARTAAGLKQCNDDTEANRERHLLCPRFNLPRAASAVESGAALRSRCRWTKVNRGARL
jgi:hypothetical protein